jgi:hypothetical protein
VKQELVTKLPTSPALGKYYMKHKIVLLQKIEVWIRTFSPKASKSCIRLPKQNILAKLFQNSLMGQTDGVHFYNPLFPKGREQLSYTEFISNTFEVILWIQKHRL